VDGIGVADVELGRSMSPPAGAWSGTATASNVPLRLFEVNMRIHVYADHPKAEQFRSIFSESVSSHYTGWSDEYDSAFR
jgi:hypothetical protein